MNKQKFIDLLRKPDSVNDSNLIELEELVNESPYFHSAHTVIARASKLLKNSQANKRVNTAAIYATSRKALKKYIQGATEFKEGTAYVVEPTKDIITTDVQKISTEVIIESTKVEDTQIAHSINDEPRSLLSTSDHDSLIDEVYDNIEEWRKSRNHFLQYELSLQEARTKQEAKQSSDVDKIKSKIAKEIIDEEEEVAQAMKGLKKPVAKTQKKDTSAKSKKPTPTKKAKAVKATKKPTQAKSASTKKAPGKKVAKSKSSLDSKDADSKDGEKKKPKESISTKSVSKNQQKTIIDKFITNSPSIQTGKLKDFGELNVDLSQKSNEFPGDIITENLAHIFESQGKADKAISIYEKLILKSPEKKSYFASRIENLKK